MSAAGPGLGDQPAGPGTPPPVAPVSPGGLSRDGRRALGVVLGALLVLAVLQGVAWAAVAPGVPYKVLADGRFGALPTTSTYLFVAAATFALSGMVLGIVVAAAAWQARSARGWQMLVTVVGGSLVGAAVAWLIGELLARGVDPATVGATAADSIVTAAPTTGTWLVVLAQPALAAVVYTFMAAWNGHPTLDRPDLTKAPDSPQA